MGELKDINAFLSNKELAVAGVSRNKKKFGYSVFKELREKDYKVYPVNPNMDEIEGEKCYRSVKELPEKITHIHIVTPKKETVNTVHEAIDKGIKNIWIQQSSDTPEAIEIAKKHKINLISKRCILMYAQPVKGFHAFHRFIAGLFGARAK